jgi:hypothetical protein
VGSNAETQTASEIAVDIVRREKALDFSGCKSPPGNWFAPPGSNRSSSGGNETAESFEEKGRFGDSADQTSGYPRIGGWEPKNRQGAQARTFTLQVFVLRNAAPIVFTRPHAKCA